MENYFIELFGFVFVIFMILLISYLSLYLVQRIWGRVKFFKEEVNNAYLKIKAKSLVEKELMKKVEKEIKVRS